jgi:hypothetical protein
VSLGSLLAALAHRFDGMGDPDNTELVTTEAGEYITRDRRWGFPMHTFCFTNQIERDDLFAKSCRRIAYLKEKFLADLQEARKTFVFKSQEIRLDELKVLHSSLQVFAPLRLLCIKEANADASLKPLWGKPGEIFEISQNLYVGFIAHMGARQGHWDIAFDDWISVCRNIDDAPPLPPS